MKDDVSVNKGEKHQKISTNRGDTYENQLIRNLLNIGLTRKTDIHFSAINRNYKRINEGEKKNDEEKKSKEEWH